VRLSMWRDSKSAWRGVFADILEGGGGGRCAIPFVNAKLTAKVRGKLFI
jgi:hypothetical protein